MTNPTADRVRAQTLDLITQGQKATLDLVGVVSESWADAVRRLPNGSTPVGLGAPAGLPAATSEAVDRFFDTGVQVLEAQRALVHSVVSALSSAASAPAR